MHQKKRLHIDEFKEDKEQLCMEIGKFLNKWGGTLSKPLEKALELLELLLS